VVETVSGRAHLIDPLDEGGWHDAMARAVADDDWIVQLRRGAVERAAVFTWERTAAGVLDVYRAVAGQGSRRAA
jgi:glycosyltransferase involved in cell wall biosynthesis